MATVNEKMTALADEIRTLSGTQSRMSLDDMAVNVENANAEVDYQLSRLNYAISTIQNKAISGGSSSGNSHAYSYSEEFEWEAPSDFETNSTITIEHSLGVTPDGFHIMACETEFSNTKPITNNIICDPSMMYADTYRFVVYLGMGNSPYSSSFGSWLMVNELDCITPTSINFTLFDNAGTQIIPVGKKYRVLVYKR